MSRKIRVPKVFRKLGKDYLEDIEPDLFNEFLRFSIQSCQLPQIEIPRLKHPGKIFRIRAQLHTLILGDFGHFKSTRMKSFPEEFRTYLQRVTAPAFFGSITEKGEPNFGVLEECAGKVLVLDEVHNLPDEVRDATLGLLEDQFYNRRTGYLIKTPSFSKTQFLEVEGHRGSLNIKGRFSCVSGGLPMIRKRSGNDWAWYSRFACLRFLGTKDDVYRGLEDGFSADSLRQERPFDPRLVVSFPSYKKFLVEHRRLVDSLAFLNAPTIEQIEAAKKKKRKSLPNFQTHQSGMIGRNALEIIRISALHALRKNRTEISEDDFHFALSFAPILMYNYAALDLTQSDYQILAQAMSGWNISKIAERMEVTEEFIRYKLEEFKTRRLIP